MSDTATERQHWTPAEAAMVEAYRDLLYTNDRLEEAARSAGEAKRQADASHKAAIRSQSNHYSKVIAVENALQALGINYEQVRDDLREQRDRP